MLWEPSSNPLETALEAAHMFCILASPDPPSVRKAVDRVFRDALFGGAHDEC